MHGVAKIMARTLVDDAIEAIGYPLLDFGLVPDWLMRWEIRRQLKNRSLACAELAKGADDASLARNFAEALVQHPTIADATPEANEQHYEVRCDSAGLAWRPGGNTRAAAPQVPTDFFAACMGHRRKYSSGLYARFEDAPKTPVTYSAQGLGEAEDAMLEL